MVRELDVTCWFILVFFFVNLWNQHVSGQPSNSFKRGNCLLFSLLAFEG